jgi:hypothetical protein
MKQSLSRSVHITLLYDVKKSHLLLSLKAAILLPVIIFPVTFTGCCCSTALLMCYLNYASYITEYFSAAREWLSKEDNLETPVCFLYRREVISSNPVVWRRNPCRNRGLVNDK